VLEVITSGYTGNKINYLILNLIKFIMHSNVKLTLIASLALIAGFSINELGYQYKLLPNHSSHSDTMGNPEENTAPMHDMVMDSDSGMNMNPEPVEAAGDAPIPGVRIVEAKRDLMGAYSVRIETSNFTFTPDRVDEESAPNEGHAHVYVNNEKVGREYAEWIYVPASFFSESGPNRITVTLNANTHGEWTYLNNTIQDTRVVN
jgi:hypothetical protein